MLGLAGVLKVVGDWAALLGGVRGAAGRVALSSWASATLWELSEHVGSTSETLRTVLWAAASLRDGRVRRSRRLRQWRSSPSCTAGTSGKRYVLRSPYSASSPAAPQRVPKE